MSKSLRSILNAMDIAQIVTETINSATSYLKEREVEETERQRILACLNAITAKLETERSKFESFMEKSFAERERLYQTMEKLIEKGLQDNDMEIIKFATNAMLNVFHKNPLSGLKETMEEVRLDGLQPLRTYID